MGFKGSEVQILSSRPTKKLITPEAYKKAAFFEKAAFFAFMYQLCTKGDIS